MREETLSCFQEGFSLQKPMECYNRYPKSLGFWSWNSIMKWPRCAKMRQAHVNSKKWRTASAVVRLVGCLCCLKAGYFNRISPLFTIFFSRNPTVDPPSTGAVVFHPGTPSTGARAGASVAGHPRVWCLQHQALMPRGGKGLSPGIWFFFKVWYTQWRTSWKSTSGT